MHTENTDPFFLRLSRLQRLFAKSLAMRLSVYDVQPGYLSILRQLWLTDNITQKELTGQILVEQATLSNTLKRMERDGLIFRTPKPDDKRQHLIRLTSTGQTLQIKVENALSDLMKTANKGLSINDRGYFERIMQQMITHLEHDQTEQVMILCDAIEE